jgi:DNA helicase HerA-like ATPase
VQHALRAFTPRDQKAVKTAAQTLRQNPKLDTETAITELAVGEALVSFLDEKGRPSVVERAFILPPASRIGPLQAGERDAAIRGSLLYGHYEKAEDRESAYEKLKARAAQAAESAPTPTPQPQQQQSGGGILGGLGDLFGGGSRGGRQTVAEAAVKSAARAIGSELGRQVLRGVLGSILGGGKRR